MGVIYKGKDGQKSQKNKGQQVEITSVSENFEGHFKYLKIRDIVLTFRTRGETHQMDLRRRNGLGNLLKKVRNIVLPPKLIASWSYHYDFEKLIF